MDKIVIIDGNVLETRNCRKVRLLNIWNNKILVTKYAGIYMLPGGKIEQDEKSVDALNRELFQEIGIRINPEKLTCFLNTDVTQSNYKSRDNKTVTKNNDTKYYLYNGELNLTNPKHLSINEQNNEFILEYIDIQELITILEQETSSSKKIAYSKELLCVLKYYLSHNQLIDLHIHTVYSDGEYTPTEIVKMAQANNIHTISITDHDTVLGYQDLDLDNIYNEYGVKVIPGIELTAKRDKGRMHILGYDIDCKNKALIELTKKIKVNNINNLKNIVSYLMEKGITFIDSDLEEIYNRIGNIGRPDIARLLIKYGIVESVQEAFDKYLVEAFNETRKYNVGFKYPEILKSIIDANGIPILAHPNSLELSYSEFEELLKDMIKLGLQGLEIYHSNMSEIDRKYYMDMVKKYNLFYSGGSDYHGPNTKPDIQLGYGKNNLYLKNLSVLSKIKKL